MSAISVELPEDVANRLQTLADRTGRSRSFLMVEAIQDHLEDMEDLYLAQERLALNQSGASESISLEVVMKRYGLES
jgi:RHH-type transcriptional regulator, rel operon repressor / antitoxin RelB